jgi:hypothetical protein
VPQCSYPVSGKARPGAQNSYSSRFTLAALGMPTATASMTVSIDESLDESAPWHAVLLSDSAAVWCGAPTSVIETRRDPF